MIKILTKTLVCLQWGNVALVNILYFQKSSYQNALINRGLYPKNDNGYFVAYFDGLYSSNLM